MNKTKKYNKKKIKQKRKGGNGSNPYANMDTKTLDDVLPILERKKIVWFLVC